MKKETSCVAAVFLLQAAYRCQLTEVVQQSASVLWRNFVGSSEDSLAVDAFRLTRCEILKNYGEQFHIALIAHF